MYVYVICIYVSAERALATSAAKNAKSLASWFRHVASHKADRKKGRSL